MANTTTTRNTRIIRKTGAQTHTTGVKLAAVKLVNMLISQGMSQTKALKQLAAKHNVSSQTIQNWRNKYNMKSLSVHQSNTQSPLVRPIESDPAYQGNFNLQSVSLQTTDGVVIRLTLDDLNAIGQIRDAIFNNVS